MSTLSIITRINKVAACLIRRDLIWRDLTWFDVIWRVWFDVEQIHFFLQTTDADTKMSLTEWFPGWISENPNIIESIGSRIWFNLFQTSWLNPSRPRLAKFGSKIFLSFGWFDAKKVRNSIRSLNARRKFYGLNKTEKKRGKSDLDNLYAAPIHITSISQMPRPQMQLYFHTSQI